jgi:Flp pilus assembly protein TadG
VTFSAPGPGREEGSLTVELVVLTPVLLLFAFLALGLGRYELARDQVIGAARAAAQTTAGSPNAALAQWAAPVVAVPTVFDRVHTCAQLSVSTDVTHFTPGGSVVVTVSCRVDLSDLMPGFPGSTTITTSVSAPIDPYRTVG